MSGDELQRGPRHDVKGRMTKTSEISKRKGNWTCVGKSDIGNNDRGPTMRSGSERVMKDVGKRRKSSGNGGIVSERHGM